MTTPDEKTIAELVRAATEFRERAYAPYSHFKVGAALLGDSGRIYPGCNVENASYGLAICAERNAFGAGVVAGEKGFRAIAVVSDTEVPSTPCGACRQFMVEFNPRMKVILASTNGARRIYDARDLLPEFFTLRD
jgi:cytidine deaminase